MKYLIGGRAWMDFSPATNLNVVRRGETSFIAFGVWMIRVGASHSPCDMSNKIKRNRETNLIAIAVDRFFGVFSIKTLLRTCFFGQIGKLFYGIDEALIEFL